MYVIVYKKEVCIVIDISILMESHFTIIFWIAVSLVILVVTEDNQLTVELSCSRMEYMSTLNFELHLSPNGMAQVFPCNSKKTFSSLTCDETYNVSAYWKSSTNTTVTCLVETRDTVLLHCRGNLSKCFTSYNNI